jgi:hypothetical protein
VDGKRQYEAALMSAFVDTITRYSAVPATAAQDKDTESPVCATDFNPAGAASAAGTALTAVPKPNSVTAFMDDDAEPTAASATGTTSTDIESTDARATAAVSRRFRRVERARMGTSFNGNPQTSEP